MEQQLFSADHICMLRVQLTADAERSKKGSSEECRQDWIDPLLWSQYTGKAGRRLYDSFTDEELLDILRLAADELGHVPSQREIFCVYRAYIRHRFTNWPTALRAAGLKAPKVKRESK